MREQRERPWWLTLWGAPPGWKLAASRPLSRRGVLWLRLIWFAWLTFFLLAIVVAFVRHLWVLPLLLLPPLLQLFLMTPEHRRQVLGLPQKAGLPIDRP